MKTLQTIPNNPAAATCNPCPLSHRMKMFSSNNESLPKEWTAFRVFRLQSWNKSALLVEGEVYKHYMRSKTEDEGSARTWSCGGTNPKLTIWKGIQTFQLATTISKTSWHPRKTRVKIQTTLCTSDYQKYRNLPSQMYLASTHLIQSVHLAVRHRVHDINC